MLQQESTTERSSKQLSARSMLLRVRHGEESVPIRVRHKLLVPFSLSEAATDTMNSGEAFEVADGDFVGSDSDDAAEFLVQVVNVKGTPAGHDGELERESGEAGMPWPWERAERVSDASVEKLLQCQYDFLFKRCR